MVRAVLDTNIIVSACLTPEGTAATIVELALLGAFTLCVSLDVLAEYQEILARDKFSRQEQRVKLLVSGIREIAIMAVPKATVSVSPDPEDNRLLECAGAAKADFLVTGNLKHFPETFENTRVVSPREFLAKLGY